MKILMYEPLLSPASMGHLIHVQELAENLSRLGNEVVLMAQLNEWPYETRVMLKPVKKFTNNAIIGTLLLAMCALSSAVFLRLRWHPDLIYTGGGLLGSSLLLTKVFRCPLVVEAKGLRRDECRVLWKGQPPLGTRLITWLTERETVRGSHVIAVTPAIKRALEAELGIRAEKVTVIPNGANTELFKPMDMYHARAELKLPDNYRFICFVGYLLPWQGIEYLIQSAPLILEKCREARFLIVGDGPMKAELLALAKDVGVLEETIFTGSVPYEKVPFYINASEVCVAPFVRERNEKSGLSPLKLYDYLACGKPVVASDIVGVADTLHAANAGTIVTPEDSESLAQAVLELLRNEELRKQMGENGRRYVVENHSWLSVAQRVAQVCKNTVEGYRR